MQHSIGKCTTVSWNVSRMIWFITANPTPLLACLISHRPPTPVIGNNQDCPWNWQLRILQKQIQTEIQLHQIQAQSRNGSLQSKQSNNNSGSTQSKGTTSEQKEPTPNLSPKLSKDGKLMPQEHQCCLNNKLCLFCGTSRYITKDCPKSSSASANSQAAKTDQESSTPSGLDSKRTKQSPWLCITQVLCWSPLCETVILTLSTSSDLWPPLILGNTPDSWPPQKSAYQLQLDGNSKSITQQALGLQIQPPTGESLTPRTMLQQLYSGYR